MNPSNITFSIIIPYYNIIEGLKRLLPDVSIYNDIQVIVVNDRSDQNIAEYIRIKEEYSKRGVLFLENNSVKGAGSCRNLGMKYALGKWILFCDADDYFTKDFHRILLEYADFTADIIYFSPISVFMNTWEPAERHIPYEKKIKAYLTNPNHVNELHLKYDIASPCSKMFSKEYLIVNALQFEEIMYSNDSSFSVKSAFYASSIEVSDKTIYCITDRAGSLTKGSSREAIQIRFDAFIRWASFLKKNLPAKDWKDLKLNAMTRLLIVIQQGASVKTLLGLIWKCMRTGIPFLDMTKLNKKTFIKTLLGIYKSNQTRQRKQKDIVK